MAGIAIFGYGNVGKGTATVINNNKSLIEGKLLQPVTIKHIFDRDNFPGDVMGDKVTQDIDKVFDDGETNVIVEAMGGTDLAFEVGARALTSGRSFVTSNKDLVASRGAELMLIAAENNQSFLFEASVGGGTPIIRPLADNLSADNIYGVSGILNGTTNYILSKMQKQGSSYSEALTEAQREGISESDPKEDVEGFDAARKLAIILSIVTGKHVDYRSIPTEGIIGVTTDDIKSAADEGYTIKLIAAAMKKDGGFAAKVAPMLVPDKDLLARVTGVYNALTVRCEATGDLTFIGMGAGGLSTGAAIASDVMDAIMKPGFDNKLFWSKEEYILDKSKEMFERNALTDMAVYA